MQCSTNRALGLGHTPTFCPASPHAWRTVQSVRIPSGPKQGSVAGFSTLLSSCKSVTDRVNRQLMQSSTPPLCSGSSYHWPCHRYLAINFCTLYDGSFPFLHQYHSSSHSSPSSIGLACFAMLQLRCQSNSRQHTDAMPLGTRAK